MARSSDPNSATCQFYITLGQAAFLDGQYAVFGRDTEGLDVVKTIRAGDVMNKVTISEWFNPGEFKSDAKRRPGLS